MVRHLAVVLGDQLDPCSSAFDGFDPALDAVWMAEVSGESTHVWSVKPRIAIFLSAMRHFARGLRRRGIALHYRELSAQETSLGTALAAALRELRPRGLVVCEPGDWRTLQTLREVTREAGIPLEVRIDRHFLGTIAQFEDHARSHPGLRMEFFYREQRERNAILMEPDGRPCGGRWNFDHDNRAAFGNAGPGFLPPPPRFEPDPITREVIALVDERFAGHPGSLDDFAWPVTPQQAQQALDGFIADRLADFGHWQDAMWTGEPWLYHAQISSSLNLKLLDPRAAIGAAQQAWQAGAVPLAAAEGFIRQILGWREYVRGVYWTRMPGYLESNALGATAALPAWYWTGETDMRCLHEVITQTLKLGYAHHIQRLMVTGLYAMLLGVDPNQVHQWYLAVYVDAVEWVEAPNTIGMSQYADGGLMASKPYAASGRYIERMSDYCRGCRYDPGKRTGDEACPFTALYWDFLLRHSEALLRNERMAPQVRNALKLPREERQAIARRAALLRHRGLDPQSTA